jgi:hypothetical protein
MLKSQKAAAETRESAFEVFQWIIGNIYLSKNEKDEIRNAMTAYKTP